MNTEELSFEDKRFLSVVETCTELVDGHYQVPLPFRNPDIRFPNNPAQAVKCLEYLDKRFKRDGTFLDDYKKFIEDMISKGYARPSNTRPEDGKTWYIPWSIPPKQTWKD